MFDNGYRTVLNPYAKELLKNVDKDGGAFQAPPLFSSYYSIESPIFLRP